MESPWWVGFYKGDFINFKPMVHDVLMHIKHVFISMEINANRISGNQHWLLDLHMVNLKPFVDDSSVDPKNDLKEINL